jgi:FixJ family two-component response regulator
MPGGMSGVEMGDRLAQIRPRVPVLYMSGYADGLRIRARFGEKALLFLGKPFQPAELLARVQEMVKMPWPRQAERGTSGEHTQGGGR